MDVRRQTRCSIRLFVCLTWPIELLELDEMFFNFELIFCLNRFIVNVTNSDYLIRIVSFESTHELFHFELNKRPSKLPENKTKLVSTVDV